MPLHRDATYANLHPPRGASLSGGDDPLALQDSAYAMHWENQLGNDVLLVDTSFSNLSIFTLGNATDPATIVMAGDSEVQASIHRCVVRAADPAAPASGVKLYSKDVAGTDHLFARTDDGTVHQLTPPAGAFDPTDIEVAPATSGAFLVHDGTEDVFRIDTTGMVTVGSVGQPLSVDFNSVGLGFFGDFGASGYVLTADGLGGCTWAPAAGGSFDPTDITIGASAAAAFRVHDGTDDWIEIDTNTPAMRFGNATDNPTFTFLGSGVLTLGSGRVAKTGNILIGDHTVAAAGTSVIAIGAKAAGTWGGSNQVIIGTTTGNLSAGAIVIASRSMSGNAGADSITIGTNASAVATAVDSISIGQTATVSGTNGIGIGSAVTMSGTSGIAIGVLSGVTQASGIAIGNDADVTAADGIAIGQDADAGNRALCLGRAAASTADNQVVIGGSGQPLSAYFFGEGVTKASALTVTEITIQPTERTGTNVAGVPIWLTGGRGTGTGVAGSIFFKGYPSGSTGTTPHTIATLWEMTPTGVLARATATNVVVGYVNTVPTGTANYVFGDLTAVTSINTNDKVLIGRHTNANLNNARFVAIAAAGGTGSYGADSVTVQSAGGAGATGNRAILVGGAGTVSGNDAQGVGYGLSLTHANCIGLGRGATSTATNQVIIGGDGFPAEQVYIGEGVTEAGGFSATAIGIQPTEGTGTNRNGLPFVTRGGRGTGTGNTTVTSGYWGVETYPAIGTGTTAHTATPRLRVQANGVMLQASHGTMSTATERDECLHTQTGGATLTAAGTWYTLITITPELGTGQYHGIVHVTGKDVGSGGLAVMALDFDIASGAATLRAYTTITDTFTFLETRATASGGSMLIEARNTTNSGDKAVAWCQWQGTW